MRCRLACVGAAVALAAVPSSLVADIPIDVNVGLLGFAGDGAWQLDLDAANLHGLLARLLPERRPSCGPEGEPLAHAVYRLHYNVVQMRTGLPALHRELASALRPAAAGQYEVRVADIEAHLDRIHASFFADADSARAAYTVLVLNPNRADVRDLISAGRRPEPDYSYRYVDERGSGGGAVPTQMWIARGRYLVLDLSAGPCAHGMTGSAEGGVSIGRVPTVHPGVAGGEAAEERASVPAAEAAYEAEAAHFLARLATLLLSAVRHVIAPDLRTCNVPDFGGQLTVPLIVLRNHKLFDPLVPGHAHSIDLAALSDEASRLLAPSQHLHLVASTHELHAHPQISVALSRAQQADTVHDDAAPVARPYLDSEALAHHLRHSVDWLAAGLLDASAAHHLAAHHAAAHQELSEHARRRAQESHLHLHAWSSEGGTPRRHVGESRRSKMVGGAAVASADGAAVGGGGAAAAAAAAAAVEGQAEGQSPPPSPRNRVLPVFVFSLLGRHEGLLLDQVSLVHSSSEAVIALQTNASALPVPFHAGGRQIGISTLDPTAHILAGLASSVGALIAPFEAFGPNGSPTLDFSWAVGHHPFGPFAQTAALPALMVDSARRHAILSMLTSALDLVDETLVSLEHLAARYLHPALADSPAHRGTSAYARNKTLAAESGGGGGGGGGGSGSGGGGGGGGGVGVGEAGGGSDDGLSLDAGSSTAAGALLSQLRAGNLRLTSELAREEALRLESELRATFSPKLASLQLELNRGDWSSAHAAAAALLAAAASAAAQTSEGQHQLEESLRCCTVHAARPRSVPFLSLAGLSLLGAAIWLGTLCLTAYWRKGAAHKRPGRTHTQ